MSRMSQVSRDQAIGMLMTGATQDDVARRFRVAPSTISSLQRRFQDTGQHRQGASLDHKYVRELSAAEEGIRTYRARVGVMLDQRRRRIRLEWARIHSNRNRDWRNATWLDVIFSDESRFLLFRHDGRHRVYCRRGKRNAEPCVVQQDRFGVGGVMVCGAIGHGWRSALVFVEGALNARRYIDLILRNHVVPYITHNPGVLFMQDNAHPHVARMSMDFLNKHGVVVLDWPPYSPDMNPIEHIWDILGRRIRRRPAPPQNLVQLRVALQEEWDCIPQRQINGLVTSVPRRINTLQDANGGHTRY
ncbi:hypothetical protein SKAU_G00194200 [Synaphobranchus kaupii]|uniref:Tc1-like transposase DDE domain-containing protein n=1 Tax=Synaphobranchus kaupii TaxID=118154 RepID=A0A9Q1FE44_SYNKA|nr:hypothetical protein SKAU_G00194200 [Synaphobranchus kaupii]